jgi:hypothetical protein
MWISDVEEAQLAESRAWRSAPIQANVLASKKTEVYQ